MSTPTPRIPATITQVAAAAGVSRSTVSRVMNGSTSVSPEALEAVQRAIAELAYVPNRAARSLVRRQTHAIALVVPEDIEKFFGDPYFAAIVSGIHHRVLASDYVLNLFVTSEDSGEKATSYLMAGNADGALVISHHANDSYVDRIAESVPVVYGGRPGPGHDHSYSVDADNTEGARTATEFLLSRGRTRIATITGPPDMPVSDDRLRGFREVLQSAGLRPVAVEGGDFTRSGARAAMQRILERGAVPDAIFVQSDLMARGAIAVLTAAGIRVPEDVSIVGFDDSPVATAEEPQLTTMRQSSFLQGQQMAGILIDLLAGKEPPRITILPTELVIRDSA